MLCIAAGFAIILLLIYWVYWALPLSKWKRAGIPQASPHFFWGNFKDVIYQKRAIFQVYDGIYRSFPEARYVGVYVMNRPGLLLRDPELIKDVMLKNFESFLDNDLFADEKVDPIFAKNPFTSKGQNWRERRIMHTKPFSSGKIKYMFNQLDQGGTRMAKFLNDEMSKDGKFSIEAIELAAKYTIYNVGNCGLGIDARTFDEENAEMREIGRKIFETGFSAGVKQFLVLILPNLSSFLSIPIISTDITSKFKRLVAEQLQYRRNNNVVRNDFFETIQEHKGQKASVDEIMVQVGGFFLDGFLTSSAFLTFILYELATNLDIQRKLSEEIDKFLTTHDGNIPYEAFQELSFLEAVVLEGLRKYPPLPVLTRLCTKGFTFPPPDDSGKPLKVQPGTPIVIPLIAIHYDEKYFPNPTSFDPNRFVGENKEKIQKFTFLPFGEGPRTCVGKRFALLQTKMMLLKIISKFEVRLNSKTKAPIQFDEKSFILAAAGGVWLDIYKRNN